MMIRTDKELSRKEHLLAAIKEQRVRRKLVREAIDVKNVVAVELGDAIRAVLAVRSNDHCFMTAAAVEAVNDASRALVRAGLVLEEYAELNEDSV